jgi:hypothetical protein
MDYARITASITALANHVYSASDLDEFVWDTVGEYGEFTLGDLIEGAYWHYTEWHGGMLSSGYGALCALGEVYSPGMDSCETDNVAYQLLNELAEKG